MLFTAVPHLHICYTTTMDRSFWKVTFHNLKTQENLPPFQNYVDGLEELERLRRAYIQWKYSNAEPRLQRTARVIQRS